MALLSDNMQIHIWCFRHKLLNCEIVQVTAQSMHRGPSHDRLGYSILTYESCRHPSGVSTCEWNNIGSEIASKLQAGFQSTLSLRLLVAIAQNVKHIQFCAQGLRQSGTTCDEITRLRARTDAD